MPFFTHDGATIHYAAHGATGQPVLLIQGVGIIGHGWKPQVDELAARHRLVTFDNRGMDEVLTEFLAGASNDSP